MTTLDIVIVNWNAGPQLAECLASIAAAGRRGVDLKTVVVVDNGSFDGSADGLENLDPGTRLTVVRNRTNRGFSRACNQGAALGGADLILFLNPDVRLFGAALAVPVAFFNGPAGPKTGIVGIQLVDASGAVTRSCARRPTVGSLLAQAAGLDRVFPHRFPSHFLNAWDHGRTRRVDQVMGAFFMVRRDLFQRLDGFDDRFFVYYEDLDFSVRTAAAGFASWFVAEAAAFHRGCGTSSRVKPQRLFYYLRSKALYGFKHFGRMRGAVLLAAALFVEPSARLAHALSRASGEEVRDTLRAFVLLLREVPALMGAARRDRGQRRP